MSLPTPNLDDRRFQDLVDEAKHMVMERCPGWTDHNVSDPGVTLIETFAFMTDQLMFRLNRVPDRLYVKFLELLGVELFPPTPATAPVTFWLSAPASAPLTIPAGTRVATLRSELTEPIVFSSLADLGIEPVEMSLVATVGSDPGAVLVDHTEQLKVDVPFAAFSAVPVAGEALMIGLSAQAPSNVVALEFRCTIDGVGVDPDSPPLTWQAWTAQGWVDVDVDRDTTGGLNRDGQVVVHLPLGHAKSVVDGVNAAWVRAVVDEPRDGVPQYSSAPMIGGAAATTVGGSTRVANIDRIEGEALGTSSGGPGQVFHLQRVPVTSTLGDPIVEVSSVEGWQAWRVIDDFSRASADDAVVTIDYSAGDVRFGPLVREADGSARQLGAIPARDANIRVRNYATGGGTKGNVAAGAIATLKSSIPFVASVRNRVPAIGGVEGEDVENAKVRGPLLLRTRGRAVTASDFELLTRQAAPNVARVRCVEAERDSPGTVKVLVVPAAPVADGKIRFEDLMLADDVLAAIHDSLDERRLVGTRVLVEAPSYQGVTVVARLTPRPRQDVARVRAEGLRRLETYLNPIVGGADGKGWPWGRPVQVGDAFAVLQGIDGVEVVEDVRLFGANPVTGERGEETTRLELAATSLLFSYEHQILVGGSR